MVSDIFESARKLNKLLERESKFALVRNGKIIGFVKSDKKKKRRKK